jgi:hypothetical protein
MQFCVPDAERGFYIKEISKTMEHQSDENYKQKVCSDDYILTFV